MAISFAILLGACKQVAMETNAEATPTALLQSYDGVVYPNSKGYTPKFLTKSASADQGDWETWTQSYTSTGAVVPIPWATTGVVTSPINDIPFLRDIKKADGWQLLVGKYEHTGMVIPAYYVFYNLYSGIMKVYYYVENFDQNNTCFWTLTFSASDGNPQKMLALHAKTPEPMNRMTQTSSSVSISNYTPESHKGLGAGWNCFVAELAYDPSFYNSTLSINARYNNTSILTLSGEANLRSQGALITTQSNGNLLGEVINASVNFVNSSEASDFISNWLKPGSVGQPGNLVTRAIQSGVSFLSKIFTGRYGGTSQTKQEINLTTTGKITFSGTIVSPSPASILPINILNFNKPLIGELGVWNLTESPTIYISPVADYVPGSPYEGGGEFDYKVRGDYRIQYDVSINPQFRNKLVKHWSVVEACIDTTTYKTDNANFNFGGAGIGPHLPGYYDRIPIFSSADNTVFKPDFTATYLVYSLLPSMLGTASDSISHFTLSKPNAIPNSTPQNFSPRYFTPPSTINITDEYAHDFVGFQGKQYRVNVTNYFVVNTSTGTTDTIVSSRQYMPRIEWDR